MTTFEHPANGYAEAVGAASIAWALLFGWLYWIAVGLWQHALVQALVVGAAVGVAGPFGALVAAPMWLGYAIAAPTLRRKQYLRAGWKPS